VRGATKVGDECPGAVGRTKSGCEERLPDHGLVVNVDCCGGGGGGGRGRGGGGGGGGAVEIKINF